MFGGYIPGVSPHFQGMSPGGGYEDEGKYVSSSWPSRFIGLRLKSVSFEDSLFEECYFEDVTSSNTFFRNCTFINTVFYNTGKVVWPVAVRPKGWVDPEVGEREPCSFPSSGFTS